MSPLHDQSPAFRQALLKSERLRILILFFDPGSLAVLFRVIRTADRVESGKCQRFILARLVPPRCLWSSKLYVLRAIGPAIKIGKELVALLLALQHPDGDPAFPAVIALHDQFHASPRSIARSRIQLSACIFCSSPSRLCG